MSNGFLGSNEIKTSITNQEVVPASPEGWTRDRYLLYKLSFINYDPCRISINGGNPIHLNSEQGFESSIEDAKIDSFVIVDSGVRFSWIGSY